MKQLNQHGFAFLDSMLMIIIVGMIFGVSLYVYNSLTNAQEAFTSTASAQEAKPTISSVVKIKEWGVEITVVGSKDVVYELADNVAWLSSTSIQKIPACQQTFNHYQQVGIAGGATPFSQGIARRMPTQKPYASDDEPYNVSIIYANSNKIGRTDNLKFIKIGDYYYQYTISPEKNCLAASGNKDKALDFATAFQTIKASK
jgi:hypothetical protein